MGASGSAQLKDADLYSDFSVRVNNSGLALIIKHFEQNPDGVDIHQILGHLKQEKKRRRNAGDICRFIRIRKQHAIFIGLYIGTGFDLDGYYIYQNNQSAGFASTGGSIVVTKLEVLQNSHLLDSKDLVTFMSLSDDIVKVKWDTCFHKPEKFWAELRD